MRNAPERLHLLVLAFALFFTCLNAPCPKYSDAADGDMSSGALALDVAAGPDGTDSDAGPDLHESTPADRTPVRTLNAGDPKPRLALDPRTPLEGRIVGFGDTPPPRAA
ncbi:MAG TPA: hypothetical protein PLB01_02395 [Thermoanaerobaculia bacterium]|nr:hypothetical protein [Thermoanaerobaculia bacterium]